MRRLFEVDLKDYEGCTKVFRRPSARAIKVNCEYRSDVFFNEVMIGREKRVLELIKSEMMTEQRL